MTRAEKHRRWEDMRAYKAEGHTMQEVADKFRLSKATAQSICKGISPQTPKSNGYIPVNKGVLKDDESVARFISERVPYEYAGNYTGCDGRADLRCKDCGTVFNRSMISIRKGSVSCPTCMAAEAKRKAQAKLEADKERKAEAERIKAAKEKVKAERQAERERIRIERIHPCPVCGDPTDRPKYCSVRCSNKVMNKRKELKRRNLIKTVMVDKDITVEGLFRRDEGVCSICGKRCNYEDYTVVDGITICGDWYPSIDHIIPLAKGGLHSWDNVQLAHRRCNWEKSDNL